MLKIITCNSNINFYYKWWWLFALFCGGGGGGGKFRSARARQFHSIGPEQSTVAERAETTVAECPLTGFV